jgi:hypothetical protein
MRHLTVKGSAPKVLSSPSEKGLSSSSFGTGFADRGQQARRASTVQSARESAHWPEDYQLAVLAVTMHSSFCRWEDL